MASIRLFAGNFAPKSYMFCDGSLLSISQNSALFSLLGTTYGGDGMTTFALPDLRGRVPIGQGAGPGLSSYVLGQSSGSANVTLTSDNMPSHTHMVGVSTTNGNLNTVGSNIPAAPNRITGRDTVNTQMYSNGVAATAPMNPSTIGSAGGSQTHNNVQPSLAVNYVICVYGIYPSRN